MEINHISVPLGLLSNAVVRPLGLLGNVVEKSVDLQYVVGSMAPK